MSKYIILLMLTTPAYAQVQIQPPVSICPGLIGQPQICIWNNKQSCLLCLGKNQIVAADMQKHITCDWDDSGNLYCTAR